MKTSGCYGFNPVTALWLPFLDCLGPSRSCTHLAGQPGCLTVRDSQNCTGVHRIEHLFDRSFQKKSSASGVVWKATS